MGDDIDFFQSQWFRKSRSRNKQAPGKRPNIGGHGFGFHGDVSGSGNVTSSSTSAAAPMSFVSPNGHVPSHSISRAAPKEMASGSVVGGRLGAMKAAFSVCVIILSIIRLIMCFCLYLGAISVEISRRE